MEFFRNFPAELQIHVANSSQRTLLDLAATSKALNQLLTPVIYGTVDLSSHNGPDIYLIPKTSKFPADWPECRRHPGDAVVYHRQRALLRTLRQRPSLGRHVRVLRWTTVDVPDDLYEAEIDCLLTRLNNGDLTRKQWLLTMEEYDFNDCSSRLWDAFACMTQLREVDIAFVNIEVREKHPPPPLFPQARSVKLSGMASPFLIKSILASLDPSLLRHLHLGSLGQFAELEGLQDNLPLKELEKLRPLPKQKGSAGAMQTHLLGFAGRWPNLQSLTIEMAAQSGDLPSSSPGYSFWDHDAEDRRYEEVGAFIRSVAPNLRSLRLQQGETGDGFKDGWFSTVSIQKNPPPDGLRPMDARFHRYILPSLMESSWPQLERLEIFGVASHTCQVRGQMRRENTPVPEEMIERLRGVLGPETVLDVRPYATRLFWVPAPHYGAGVYQADIEDWTEDESSGEDEAEDTQAAQM